MKAKAIIFTGVVSAMTGLAVPLASGTQNTTAGSAADQSSVGQFSPPPNLPPPPVDRANDLIGMKVMNPSNQTLGTVTDVVFDLQSGRVSYIVVKKADRAHGTGKYVAVPPSAVAPSPDMKHLVLNTDKKSMEHSQGFSRNNYPPAGEPAYGAQPTGQSGQEQQIIIVPVVPSPSDQNKSPGNDEDQDRNQGQNPGVDQDQDMHTLPAPE